MHGRRIRESWRCGLAFVVTAVVTSGFGAGCARNETVKAYEAWADTACACSDSACRAAAIARGVKLAQDTLAAEGTLKDSLAVKTAASRAARCLNAVASATDAGGAR